MSHLAEVENMQKELELCWVQKMSDFEKRLNAAMTPTNPTIQQLRDEFQAFKDVVTKMLHLLSQQVQNNANAIDMFDMRSRRKILLFNGIPEDPNVDVEHKILELLQNKMGLSQVTKASIKRCHRLGSIRGNNHIRPVLVHFHDHKIKAAAWTLKTKLKGTPMSVSEFLTKMRQSVFKRARRHFNMKSVWTLDGIIYVKLPHGERAKISTEEELDVLIGTYPTVSQSANSDAISSDRGVTDSLQPGQQSESLSQRQSEVRRKQLAPGSEDSKRSRRPPPKK